MRLNPISPSRVFLDVLLTEAAPYKYFSWKRPYPFILLTSELQLVDVSSNNNVHIVIGTLRVMTFSFYANL